MFAFFLYNYILLPWAHNALVTCCSIVCIKFIEKGFSLSNKQNSDTLAVQMLGGSKFINRY